MLQSLYEYMIVLKTKELAEESDASARAIEAPFEIRSQWSASRSAVKGLAANTGSNN
jgi:hypothetical protein